MMFDIIGLVVEIFFQRIGKVDGNWDVFDFKIFEYLVRKKNVVLVKNFVFEVFVFYCIKFDLVK